MNECLSNRKCRIQKINDIHFTLVPQNLKIKTSNYFSNKFEFRKDLFKMNF